MDREAFCSAGGSPVSGVGGGREPRQEKDEARGCPFRFGRIPPPENPCASAGGSVSAAPPDFLFRRTSLPLQARQGSFSLVAGFVALSEKPPVSYESPRRSRGTVRQEGDVPTRFQTPGGAFPVPGETPLCRSAKSLQARPDALGVPWVAFRPGEGPAQKKGAPVRLADGGSFGFPGNYSSMRRVWWPSR